jgi:hypothetical protein
MEPITVADADRFGAGVELCVATVIVDGLSDAVRLGRADIGAAQAGAATIAVVSAGVGAAVTVGVMAGTTAVACGATVADRTAGNNICLNLLPPVFPGGFLWKTIPSRKNPSQQAW